MNREENNNRVQNAVTLNTEMEENEVAKIGCGPLAKYPVLTLLVAVGLGILVGYFVSEIDDVETKSLCTQWLGLIGELFIRGLTCCVLPLVFFNIILAVKQMLSLGNTKVISYATLFLYLFTTFAAALIGVFCTLIFKSQWIVLYDGEETEDTFNIICSEGEYLTKMADGSVSCLPGNNGSNTTFDIMFNGDSLGSTISGGSSVADDVSLSDTIYDGVFMKLFAKNIFQEFYNGNFTAVVVFAIIFGVGLFYAVKKRGGRSISFDWIEEFNLALIKMINWLLIITPFAVFSLVSSALGGVSSLSDTMVNVGYLIAAASVGFLIQIIVVYCGLYLLIVRSNPFPYLRHLLPVQSLAFACSSSASCIPLNIQCTKNSKMVDPLVSNFVIPLGATLNMDGGAIYFSIATFFMATTAGLEDEITVASYLLMIIISTIGSAGTAPIPSASLALIITAYNTVFTAAGTPPTFSYVLAIDFLIDRFRTVTNVTGDAIVTRLVSHILEKKTKK